MRDETLPEATKCRGRGPASADHPADGRGGGHAGCVNPRTRRRPTRPRRPAGRRQRRSAASAPTHRGPKGPCRSPRVAPRPRMGGAMHHPLLRRHGAIRTAVDRPRIPPAAGDRAALRLRLRRLALRSRPHAIAQALRDDRRAVARIHGGVAVSVEHDGRHRKRAGRASGRGAPAATPLHRGVGRRQVVRGAEGQAGVDPDRRVHLRVGGGQHGRHCPTGGQPGRVHAPLVQAMRPTR